MRVLALAFTLLLAQFAVASAQTATPDSENGRYSFYPVADGVLRLDTRTGQISQCSRLAGCKHSTLSNDNPLQAGERIPPELHGGGQASGSHCHR